MPIVYIHKRKTNGEIFYVGVGKNVSRAYDKWKRSNFWKAIAQKHGVDVEIVCEFDTIEEAKDLEIELISKYGRIDNGTGILCNMTDGGDGAKGAPRPDCVRKKISESQIGKKVSENTRVALSKAWDRRRLNKEKKRKYTKKRGDHWNSKSVLDLENGIFYDNLKDAADSVCMKHTTAYSQITRNTKNKRFTYI